MTYHKYAVSLCGDVALWREQTVEVQGEVEPGVFIQGQDGSYLRNIGNLMWSMKGLVGYVLSYQKTK